MNPALPSLPSHFHRLAKLQRFRLGRHQIGGFWEDLGGGSLVRRGRAVRVRETRWIDGMEKGSI